MFRFSIRELMLVTLVVAMGLGWFSTFSARRTLFRQHEELERSHAIRGQYTERLKEELREKIGLSQGLSDALRRYGDYNVPYKKGRLPADIQDEWFFKRIYQPDNGVPSP